MKTKRIVVLFLTVFCVVLAMMLCSCSLFGGGGGNTPTPDPKDKEGEGDNEGWSVLDNPNIYNALILGCTNVAFQGSKKSIESNKGVMTLDSKLKLTLGDTSLWIVAKGKYKSDSPRENAIVSIEVCTDETPSADNRIVAAYVCKDKIYFALGKDFPEEDNTKNNKVKLSLANIAWQDYFPYQMEKQTSADISTLSGIMSSSVETNKANKGEYRRKNGVDEYRYSMDIDLGKTLTQLFNTIASTKTGFDNEIIKVLKEFVAVFYGVTEDDILDGKLPDSRLVVDFETHSNVISSLKLSFDVDLTGKTMLFSGGEMHGTLSVEKLKIDKDYSALKIPFANDTAAQQKFADFNGAIFSVDVPLDEYEGTNVVPKKTALKVTTKFFQGVGSEDFIFAEYRDIATGTLKSGVYAYNNIMYFYSLKDGEYTCLCSLDVHDLGELATKIASNDLGGTGTFEPTKLLAYIINGVAIEQTGIKFSIKPNFYTDVWFNFDDLCAYVDSLTEETLLDVEGVRGFFDYVKMNEVIMTFETDTPFLSIVNSSDRDVSNVVRMLESAGDETRLTPVGSGQQ